MGEPLLNGDASQCKKQQATGPLRNCAQPPPGKLNSHRSPRKCSEEFLRRSEEHTSELQSPCNLVCRLLLEKKKQHSLQLEQDGLAAALEPLQKSISYEQEIVCEVKAATSQTMKIRLLNHISSIAQQTRPRY